MEKNETTQQAFVFHPSFWNALKELDDNSLKNEIAFAIISYGNEGEVELAELSPVARFAMRLIMPIIDKQQETYRRKRDAGKSGGRPKNENQKGENEKPIQNQTPDFEKANQNQNCNPEKASQNQTESTNNFRLGKEKEKDIFFNKDIEKEKDIVFLKEKETENATEVSDDKNKKTDLNFSEIKKYFVGKGFDESTAQRFIDYNINHNKKVPNDWKHYADKWIENEKNEKQKTTPPIDRTAPPNPETEPIQGKGYIFDTIQQKNWNHNLFDPNPIGKDPYGRQLYKLKTA